MTFEEWFDNPESLHGNDYFKDALRRAWKAGAKAEREKLLEMCKCHEYCSDLADTIRALEEV